MCAGAGKRHEKEAANACSLASGFQCMLFTCGFRNILLLLFLGSNGNPSLIAAGFP